MKNIIFIFMLLIIFMHQSTAQNWSDSTQSLEIRPKSSEHQLNLTRFGIVTTSVIGVGAAVHIYQYNSWWKNYRRPFHFQEDLIYSRSVDKVGHVWGAAFSSFVIARSYEWTGLSKPQSMWIGAVGGSLFQLFVEFQDGFSQWGFDRVDAAADIAGGFYPLLQYYVPELNSLNIKASYYPRQLGKVGNIPGQKHVLIDDYEGQTFWLSFDTSPLLTDDLDFLKYFGVAVGYSVRDLHDYSNQYGILLVALDYNFKKIIPQDSDFLKALSEGLNYFKFPSPAIQISPKLIMFGLYF
ncbi:MAG: hypothetical protein QME25_01955 [Bacteroidota bacterium]|nr:hypothetical protein [Bacteroidota bacterium]